VTHAAVHEVATSQGPARLHIYPPATEAARGTLLLGHGAGGGVEAADLSALTGMTSGGWLVVLLEQPWRVAGRRLALAPARLDEATTQMLEAVDVLVAAPRPWVLGGRSAGARVACRLRSHAQALCLLAFPLTPPPRNRRSAREPVPRTGELLGPVHDGMPTLVMQGHRDRFGGPQDIELAVRRALEREPGEPLELARSLTVRGYPGDHGPTRDLDALQSEVAAFLDALP
jgi:hypothetical protein